ncbi:hypothetical protein [Luteimonas sp. SDU82]|uniref:hypothetical protein n=1 Tax=Luteimonas sp. SDU82 TaxID=3422592 RepID=UPI003EB89140
MRLSMLITVALISLCTGCATTAGSKAPPDLLAGNVYYDTQASLGPCPSNDEAETGLGAVFAASVIAQGVSKIGEALKSAGNAETQAALAQRNIEIRTSDGIGPCIVIARGWFYKNIPPLEGAATQDLHFEANSSSAFPASNDLTYRQAFWRMGLSIASTPDFYFKGVVKPSTGGTAYVIYPLEATLDRPISSNILRPSGKRHVMLAFALSEAGTSVDLAKGGTVITLGAMKPGELLKYPDGQTCFVSDHAETLTPGACPPRDEFSLLVRNPIESNWFKIETSDKIKPMTLQALVTETRSASKFLQFVGAVFGDTSEPITEELQRKFIPSIGEEAGLAEMTADEATIKTYDNALSKAYSELTACIGAPNDVGKRIAARVAVRDLLAAARNADMPHLELSADDISTSGEDDGAQCKAQRDKIK